MIAARLHEYGKAPILEEIPIPDIQPDEILVDLSEVMALAVQDKIRHTIKAITFDQINENFELSVPSVQRMFDINKETQRE